MKANKLSGDAHPGQCRALIRKLVERRSLTETLPLQPRGACLVMMPSQQAVSGFQPDLAGNSGILCFLLDPNVPVQLNQSQLSTLYQLTPAELRLAGLLVRGLDVTEASAVLKISPHTGRTHLRSIKQKVGVNRQDHLQRKLLLAAGTLRHPDD